MRFVAEKTTIPVPHVIDCIEISTGAFIVMTKLPGEPMQEKHLFMTGDEHARFVQDMGSCLKQLHALTAPDSRISAFDGSSFRDWRIDCTDRQGPFDSEREFYDNLYKNTPRDCYDRLCKIACEVHDVPHRLCLTHNDLLAHNILVENNRLSGLVDWECTAWLPEWWEYTASIYMRHRYQEWIDLMNSVHPEIYTKELEVEKEFWLVNSPI